MHYINLHLLISGSNTTLSVWFFSSVKCAWTLCFVKHQNVSLILILRTSPSLYKPLCALLSSFLNTSSKHYLWIVCKDNHWNFLFSLEDLYLLCPISGSASLLQVSIEADRSSTCFSLHHLSNQDFPLLSSS